MTDHRRRARDLVQEAESWLRPPDDRPWDAPGNARDIAYGHALAALASAHISLWAAEGDDDPPPLVVVEPLPSGSS